MGKDTPFNFAQAVVEVVSAQRNQALDTVAMQAATIAQLKLQLGQAELEMQRLRKKREPKAPPP